MTGQSPSCSIVIKGPIDASWADYYGDLVLSAQVHNGEIKTTMLSGSIPDLGAFIGLVTRVHNHGLTVLRVDYEESTLRL